jgi:hypothetical protein
MATITLQRSSDYNNRLRDYKIFIDGEHAGNISNGDTKSFTVPAGKHDICAKIDWCSSQEINFNVSDNETVYFTVGGYRGARMITWIILSMLALHYILQKTVDFHYTVFFVAIPFLVMLYYISIGRKRYLSLKQVNSFF